MYRFAKGYTLIELLIVMAIITVVGVIAFYAFGSTNNAQAVAAAQLEFATNLRSVVNGVNNGASGLTNQYFFITTSSVGGKNLKYELFDDNNPTNPPTNPINSFPLPAGVKICLPNSSASTGCAEAQPQLYICIANPNLTAYSQTPGKDYCSTCNPGAFFACRADGMIQRTPISSSTDTLIVRFMSTKNSAIYKDVAIEGSGMSIARVNPL